MGVQPRTPGPGSITWRDLTVPDADRVRDFYGAVVGWTFRGEDMGGYQDWHVMAPGSDESIAGICWARGSNADMPAAWLLYVLVPDVEAAAARCRDHGGSVVTGPRRMGAGWICVIRDPAGAMLALWQAGDGAAG